MVIRMIRIKIWWHSFHIFTDKMVIRMQFILHMTFVWWYCVGIHGMIMERHVAIYCIIVVGSECQSWLHVTALSLWHIMTSRRDVTGMVTMAELLSLVNVYCYHWYNVRIYIYIYIHIMCIYIYIYIHIYIYNVYYIYIVIQYVFN